ncbi:uncharacterized protein F5Z01DRAFT_681469 [Emericellopsis atlantica]|uniref:Glycosyl transferase n=1 Tax=Emericellopsis atlantica TaxID=2614577 RepID=A0A9P7ZM18_9HYPO|nr:uncharacterized protein F5Z01DRAFT_681469 [Emericellopsis atlantica]KAG9254426.1 hypothetical protein F5Z01DRAFT_681469 [Emericellopsis atlantica]
MFQRRLLRPLFLFVSTIVVVALCIVSFIRLPYETRAYVFKQGPITSCTFEKDIPNIVHLVYILKDPIQGDFPLQFSQFLSIYALSKRWQPDAIYLHTNAEADGGSNGKHIKMLEHKSDFARVKAVHDFGGIYVDLDVHALQDINPVHEAGYRAVVGRQLGGDLQSGSFMSEKGGRLVKEWMERMHEVYDGRWITHSNKLLTTVGEELVNTGPCEVLIMGRDAWAPGGWVRDDTERLYGEHDDVESNIAGLKQGDSLPEHDDMDGYDRPEWAFDYSCTYLLHAFSLEKPRDGVKHNRITPKYVLERRSNFGRAVYSIAKELYDKGIITIDETL